MATNTDYPGVALITGAAGTGIGNAVAKAFAAAGCRKIAITDRNHELLKGTESDILKIQSETQVVSIVGDISSPDFADSLVDETVKKLGRLDYCVNCAGIMGNNQPSTESSLEDFDRINNINYRGLWLSSRAQIKAMLKQEPLPSHDPARLGQRGSIVNIASQLGIVGRPAAPAYCAGKAAVLALSRSDAIDYAADGIRVNAVCPGVIATPMTNDRAKLLEPAVAIAPMNRMGLPQEVADCCLFLASTKASFVTGSGMVVDGGYIIN